MKHLITLLFIFSTFQIVAQERIFVKAGLNLSNYSDEFKYLLPGSVVGVSLDQEYAPSASLVFDLEYKPKGMQYTSDGDEFKQRIHYLQHSIGVKQYVSNLYFGVGGFIAFKLSNTTELSLSGVPPDIDLPDFNPKISNDAGVWGVIGWTDDARKWAVQLQYDKGLVNIYPSDKTIDVVVKTQTISLNVLFRLTKE